jgi:hypothetical protein
MPRGPSTFRQTALTRACKGVQAAGCDVAKVEIDADGKITVTTTKGAGTPMTETPFDEWKRQRDARPA